MLATHGTTGDVQPLLALAVALRQRGHRPLLAAPPDFEARARDLGVEFTGLGPPTHAGMASAVTTAVGAPNAASQAQHALRALAPQAAEMVHGLSDVSRDADLLVAIPFQFAASIVRETARIPYASVHLSPFGSGSGKHFAEATSPIVNECRARFGLPPLPDPLGADGISSELALYAVSGHVFRRPTKWPPHCQLTGYFFLEERAPVDPRLEAFLADGAPVVVSFGSMRHEDPDGLTKLLLGGFARVGCRAVIQRGWSGLARGRLPDSVYAVDFVPHGCLFPRASCVVHAGGAGTTAAAFRAGVPSVIVPHWLDQPMWALTARGLGAAAAIIPIADLTEERLAEALAKTLAADDLRRSATQLGERVRSEDGLATACAFIEAMPVRARAPLRVDDDRDAGVPASFAQERLWFLHRRARDVGTYTVTVALRLRGDLVQEPLRAALETVVARHGALRTIVCERDQTVYQIVKPPQPFDLGVIEARSIAADQRDHAIRAYAEAERRDPMHPTALPVFRARLVRFDDADHALLITMHQMVADRWALGIVVEELGACYGAFLQGEPPSREAPSIDYADFAGLQRREHARGAFERSLAHWRRTLADAPRGMFQGRGATPAGGVQRVAIDVPAPLAEALRTLGRRARATLYMIMLAAFDVVLARHLGRTDIVVGTILANRMRPEAQRLVGFLANPIALRMDLSGAPSFAELLQRVRRVVLAAQAHQEVPFELVNPVFDVMLTIVEAQTPTTGFGDLDVAVIDVGGEPTALELNLVLTPREGGLSGALWYRPNRFDDGVASLLAKDFGAALDAMAADPDGSPWNRPIPAPQPETIARAPILRPEAAGCPTERALQEIWSELLGTFVEDLNANFFDLGGDSLLALRMIREAEIRLGRRLALTVLFEGDTIASLAAIIDRQPIPPNHGAE